MEEFMSKIDTTEKDNEKYISVIQDSFEQLFGIFEVNYDKCIGCGRCKTDCPYNAIELVEATKQFEDVSFVIKKPIIDAKSCKGCGVCAVSCPSGAISELFKDIDQFSIVVKTIL